MNYTFSSDWIHKQESVQHWVYYWHQVNVLNSNLSEGDTILEIGVGTRFTSNYLKSKGYSVTTIDIDPDKHPDIVANIVEYDFKEKFDHIVAFEVFEHIPFEEFIHVMKGINKICNKNMYISIPRNEKVWLSLLLEFPGSKKLQMKIAAKRGKILSKHHHWELDYKKYTKKYIEEAFNDVNFTVESRRKVYSLCYYTLIKSK